MNIWIAIGFAVIGYLIGSISFARIMSRIASPSTNLDNVEIDSRTDGMETVMPGASATTASLVHGPKVGGSAAILDIIKGFFPTLVVRLLFPDDLYFLFTGAGTVIGHVKPLYHKFRGGWGVSPMLGTFLVLDPIGLIVSNAVALLLGLYVFKDIIIIGTGGTVLMIIWLLVVTGKPVYAIYAVVINIILFLALLPGLITYRKDKASGAVDFDSIMNAMPMGRMLKKMMPDKKSQGTPPTASAEGDPEAGSGT